MLFRSGGAYPSLITRLRKGQVSIRVLSHENTEVESPLRVTLAQGISARERMEFTLKELLEEQDGVKHLL